MLLEPGTITHSPRMGLGLISKYRYMQSDRVMELTQAIKDQIKDYLDNTVAVNVDVHFAPNGENVMIIDMEVNQYQFRYFYDRDKLTLEMMKNEDI